MLLRIPLPVSDMTESPATTPIPVQLSESEFAAFFLPAPVNAQAGAEV
jgi:hypothetical protein